MWETFWKYFDDPSIAEYVLTVAIVATWGLDKVISAYLHKRYKRSLESRFKMWVDDFKDDVFEIRKEIKELKKVH